MLSFVRLIQRDLQLTQKNCKIILNSQKKLSTDSPLLQNEAADITASFDSYKKRTFASKEERDEFAVILPQVIKDLQSKLDRQDLKERFSALIYHSVLPARSFRGLTTVAAYKMFEKKEHLTLENVKKANILGWALELFHGAFIVADDIVDCSEVRRGLPCWHRKEDVGLNALNDLILLQQGPYVLLKKYFSDHQSYVPMVELFHDLNIKTACGQLLDSNPYEQGKPNLNLFTMDKFEYIAKHKTAYYTFYFPVVAGMHLANAYNEEKHKQIESITMDMGVFYQVQDDFLDCFGDPEASGKLGNDIREGKCTWFAVLTLQKANRKQREVMEKYYGSSDSEAVDVIKGLYEELDLPKAFASYEEKAFETIQNKIKRMPENLPQELFNEMVGILFKRIF